MTRPSPGQQIAARLRKKVPAIDHLNSPTPSPSQGHPYSGGVGLLPFGVAGVVAVAGVAGLLGWRHRRMAAVQRTSPPRRVFAAAHRASKDELRTRASRAIKAREMPETLMDGDMPYFEADPKRSIWAETGYGQFRDDLVQRVLRGDLRHGG